MSSQSSKSQCSCPKIGLILIAVFSALMACQSLAIFSKAVRTDSMDLAQVRLTFQKGLMNPLKGKAQVAEGIVNMNAQVAEGVVQDASLLNSKFHEMNGFVANYDKRTEFNRTHYIVWSLVWFVFMATHCVLTSLLAHSFSVWKVTHTVFWSGWIFVWTLVSLFFLICNAKPYDVYGMTWTVLADAHSLRKGLAYTICILALLLYPLCWYFALAAYPKADEKGTYSTIEEEESDDEPAEEQV